MFKPYFNQGFPCLNQGFPHLLQTKITEKSAQHHGLHHLHAGLEELWIHLHAAALLEPSDGVVPGEKLLECRIRWDDGMNDFLGNMLFGEYDYTTGKIYTKYDNMLEPENPSG